MASPLSSAWVYRLLIIVVGTVAAAPMVLSGFPFQTHDSGWHLLWWSNFAPQFWSGEPYPRWLLEANEGLGSPAFFYYPPLPYWVSTLLSPPGQPAAVWMALGWGSYLGLVLSGLAAFACFQKMGTHFQAFAGAALYMVMPPHLALGLLERGAYAEYWAFASMPIIVCGVLKWQRHESYAGLVTTTGFACLFLTHLPTSVTFTPFALLLALCLSGPIFFRTLLAALAGAGLAGVYLIPALTTQDLVSIQHVETPYRGTFFFPTFDIWMPFFTSKPFHMRLLLCFALFALVFLLFYYQLAFQSLSRSVVRQRLPWLGLGGGTLLMMLPFADPIYLLFPKLQMIQFAWRFLTPASLFLAATLMAFWPGEGVSKAGRISFSILLLGLFAVSGVMTSAAYVRTGYFTSVRKASVPASFQTNPDVPEYRPRWVGAELESTLAKFTTAGSARGKVAFTQGGGSVQVDHWMPRQLALVASLTNASTLLVRQYYFPGWTAWVDGKAAKVQISEPDGLVQLSLPPGVHRVQLRLRPTIQERLGQITSASSLLIGLTLVLRTRFRDVTRANRGRT